MGLKKYKIFSIDLDYKDISDLEEMGNKWLSENQSIEIIKFYTLTSKEYVSTHILYVEPSEDIKALNTLLS